MSGFGRYGWAPAIVGDDYPYDGDFGRVVLALETLPDDPTQFREAALAGLTRIRRRLEDMNAYAGEAERRYFGLRADSKQADAIILQKNLEIEQLRAALALVATTGPARLQAIAREALGAK